MDILGMLSEANAVHKYEHFVYTSGMHGKAYVNLRVLKLPKYKEELKAISLALFDKIIEQAGLDMTRRTIIVGPETLGELIAQNIFDHYTGDRSMGFTLLALKHTGKETFGWEFPDVAKDTLSGAQVVLVDDLMTEGSTLERCRVLIEEFAPIAAVGVIVDRGGKTAEELRVPHFVSLEQVRLEAYPADKCSLCEKKRPIVTNLGHGKNFQLYHPNYPGGFTEV